MSVNKLATAEPKIAAVLLERELTDSKRSLNHPRVRVRVRIRPRPRKGELTGEAGNQSKPKSLQEEGPGKRPLKSRNPLSSVQNGNINGNLLRPP